MDTTLLVTTNAPVAQCMQFDDNQGKKQLFCILRGETSVFRVSTATSSREIHFITSIFQNQLKDICRQAEEEQMRKLCSLLISEVVQGRVIVVTNQDDGKVVATTSASLERHAKARFTNVVVADNTYFEEITRIFTANLECILAQTAQFNAKQNSPETHLEAAKKQIDKAIITKIESNWSLSHLFFGVVSAISDFFKPTAKVLEKFVADAREQARLSHEHQVEDRKKTKERKHKEKAQEVVKQDRALFERKLETVKTDQRLHQR